MRVRLGFMQLKRTPRFQQDHERTSTAQLSVTPSITMKCFILGILLTILFASLHQAQGLDCYKCKSSQSWDDCTKSQRKVACKTSAQNCCKAVGTTTVSDTKCTVYEKFCEGEKDKTENKCSGKVTFNWSSSKTCCSGSLCNTGAHNHESQALFLFMIASAIMLLFLH